MPSPANCLPVYAASDQLVGYVTPHAAQRMLSAGHAVARGSRHRIRALIATHDNIDLIPSDRMPAGQKYSHNRETRENPQGVWTFKKLRPLT